jgi:outer membrane protein TolC
VDLSLREAVERARERNVDLRVAGARSDAARARARAAAAPLLPRLDLESGWSRTTDPVGAFGTKLRQGVFGPDDLAIDALNDPDPVTDWSTSVVVRWSVASPERWAARSAAESRAASAGWREARSREATDLRTRSLYYRALRAEARVRTAGAALEAARSTEERFRRRREEGMLTEADLLQARAEREAAAADLSAAREGRHGARIELGLHLGWDPGDTLPSPADSLAPPEAPTAAEFDPARRADVRARAAAVEAAEANSRRAELSWLPSVEAFGSWSRHGDDPFSGGGTGWTVGVGLRWSLFTGFRRPAEAREADAGLTAARLEHRQALREARGEVSRASRRVEAVRQAVEASRAAREAAREGRELMRRRFEEGLATPSDLLQAEARATAMEVRAVDALARYHVARARLRFARSQSGAGGRP